MTLQPKNVFLLRGEGKYGRYTIILIFISLLIRGLLAWLLEMGNDEVYYWTYALYPDWSHFDHPPMVGLFIQFTTQNLLLDQEFFLRLSSVLLGGVNTWLIYRIGCRISSSLAGFYAAFLYNTSIYCFVIAGIFILPDTPQLFFWLLSLLLLIRILPDHELLAKNRRLFLLAGLTIGLALLSKYTSAWLWIAAGIYIILYNRNWLKSTELYVSVLISVLIFSPVIYWNYQHHFISFTFHGDRVSLFSSGIRPDFFFTELAGQVMYNNPVNFILIVVAVFALAKKRFSLNADFKRILLLASLPLAGMFLFFALFRQTLPHWSGPGYIALILIAAVYLSQKNEAKRFLIPLPLMISALVMIAGLSIGLAEIKAGFIGQQASEDPKKLGRHDVTLDMSGWRKFVEEFRKLRIDDIASGEMSAMAPIIITRWFPGAHLDYYVARPSRQNVIGVGELKNLHKYSWINRLRPGLYPTSDAYYITTSRDFKDPLPTLSPYFTEIEEPVIIQGFKGEKHVRNFFIYRLKRCHTLPPDILEANGIELEFSQTH